MTLNHLKIYCKIALAPRVIKRAVTVSLIVGTILNLINQGVQLIHLNFDEIHLLKILLTYFVPYAVTIYTTIALKIEFQIGTQAIIETDLECKTCHATLHVKMNELIHQCSHCTIHTRWKLK